MMITKANLILVFAACLVSGCSADREPSAKGNASYSAAPIVDTSEAISVRLTANKHKFKAGEDILIHGSITNGTALVTSIQSKLPFGTASMTVTVPGGGQYVYTPYALKLLPQIDASFYSDVQHGETITLFELMVRAGQIHHGQDYWQCTASNETLPLPFKSKGKYTIRLDYLDPIPKKEGAFKGGRSAELTIEMRD